MKCQQSTAAHKVLTRVWRKLATKHFGLNGFESLDQLLAEFCGATCGGPFGYVVYRIDPDLKFEPGNVRLAAVHDDSDLAAMSWPAL